MNLTLFTPTSSAKAKATESSSSISGSTRLPISTPTLSSGIPNTLCKFQTLKLLIIAYLCEFLDGFSLELLKSSILCFFSFSVDGTPIRKFKNLESKGVPYPKNQAMRIYSSLWNADDWATRGGLVKTDWSQAPFTASYRNFKADACVWSSGASSCGSNSVNSNSWMSQELDSAGEEKLKWVQKNYMIYNYCTDSKRFPQGFPPECLMA